MDLKIIFVITIFFCSVQVQGQDSEGISELAACGFNAVATTTSQPITSPNYPGNYPNNADCTWTITANDGMRVQLNLIRFLTETSYDYLTISSDGSQLARLSGSHSNRIYRSTGSTLTLTFTSDGSVSRSGFTATFVEYQHVATTTTAALTCGYNAVATSTSQPITSLNYPNNYPNNANCTWTITANDGMGIKFNLHTFETERNFDYLTVRDCFLFKLNISSDGRQLARLSGSHSDRMYRPISSENSVTIRFTSDRSVTRSGFNLTFVEYMPVATTASSCGFNAFATLTSQPITSPNYPNNYPNNADCTWTITASDGMRVQLNLIRLSTERNYDYLTISSDGTQLARISGTYSNRIYTSIANTLTLRFTSDRSVTRTGFNATFVEYQHVALTTTAALTCGYNAVATSTSQPITSPNYPNNYPNNANCTWTITASDGMRVQLNLIRFSTERNYDYLTISSDGRQLARLSGSHSDRMYRPISSENYVTIRFTSDRSVTRSGFNLTFVEYMPVATTASSCGFNAVATLTSQPITSPNYPNNYPNNADCTWTITATDGMRVQLNLIRLSTERNYDYLTISSDGTQLARISGTYSNRIYTSIGNTLTLRFTSDRSVTRTGFNATFVEYQHVATTTTAALTCGYNAVATSTSQSITSPNYPNNYPNNADCTWTITANDGMGIKFNLHIFETERNYDYITVFSNGTQLARLSGSHLKTTYILSENSLNIRFTTDSSITRSGFNVTFVEYMPVVTTASSCGFNSVATSTSQPITSPNYPNNYPNNADCTWTITASDGMRVQLNLIRFLTETNYDYITISSDGTQLARISGTYLNRIYTSIGNSMTLRFTSDRSVTRSGFKATFVEYMPVVTTASSCGFNAVATSTSQLITSPGYPNNYPNNADCTWNITASDGMGIKFILHKFETETNYDYTFSNGTLVGRLSGSHSNTTYISSENSLNIRFTSDSSITRSGFNVTFIEYMPVATTASSCGFNAVATSTSQLITSPNYPNNYPNNADCTWTITASDGMRVQLNLIRFSTERNYDYLTISSDGSQLARISGTYLNRIYTSIGNTLTLRFTSHRSVTVTGFIATFFEVHPTTTPETTTAELTTQASSCGFNAVATSTSQLITSPNYPNNYPNNANCTWTITASDGMRVQLNLIRFSTERNYDHLTISSDGTMLARNSGTYSNRIYTSIGNTLTLRFTSDRSFTRSGFNATFVEFDPTTMPQGTPESTLQAK
ncbi:cubilin [Ciona intestinalis]